MPAPIPDEILLAKVASLNLPPTFHLEKEIIRSGKYRKIWGRCDLCGVRKEYGLDNLLSKKTTQCKCQRGIKYQDKATADVIGERYDAMKQRCKEGGEIVHPRYNGRGIRNKFRNRKEYVDCVLDLLKEKYPKRKGSYHVVIRRLDIDRIDNNGHYEPKNVRLVHRSENLKNQERTRHTFYEGRKIPTVELWHLLAHDDDDFAFSIEWTQKLAKAGLTGEEILERSRSRRIGGKKVVNVVKLDENILIKHGKLPMPTSMKQRSASYFDPCGRV